MYCSNCGKSNPDGSKFCLGCGAPTGSSPAPVEPERKKKAGAGFWTSGAGIALVVILGIAVIAGVTFGIIFLVRSGPDNEVDASTVKVWDEYESLLEENSQNVPQITMDQTALKKSQEDLKKAQDKVAALQRVLKETGGTKQRKLSVGRNSTTSTRDIKADQMAAALASYNLYIQKMNELFTTLAGANLLDPNVVNKLNQILTDLQKLGVDVIALSNKFLANNPKVVTTKIDPPIIKYASTAATDLQKSATEAQAAEQQRLATEKAAADKVAADAAAQQAAQQQQASEMVACPACGGTGIRQGSDSSWTCTFCGGTGMVTRSKAATYVNIE
jgi:transposase-like protein